MTSFERSMIAMPSGRIVLGLSPQEADRVALELTEIEERHWEPGLGSFRVFDFEAVRAQNRAALEAAIPAHAVDVAAFEIDVHPVTNADWARFMAETGARAPTLGAFEPEGHAVVGISWTEAQAYARHYGLELPTEAEWAFALARHPEIASGLMEYTADHFSPYPGADAAAFERRLQTDEKRRCVRGGIHVAWRSSHGEDARSQAIAFRCVRRTPKMSSSDIAERIAKHFDAPWEEREAERRRTLDRLLRAIADRVTPPLARIEIALHAGLRMLERDPARDHREHTGWLLAALEARAREKPGSFAARVERIARRRMERNRALRSLGAPAGASIEAVRDWNVPTPETLTARLSSVDAFLDVADRHAEPSEIESAKQERSVLVAVRALLGIERSSHALDLVEADLEHAGSTAEIEAHGRAAEWMTKLAAFDLAHRREAAQIALDLFSAIWDPSAAVTRLGPYTPKVHQRGVRRWMAVAFDSDLDYAAVFDRLTDVGPWAWKDRDSAWYGNFASARRETSHVAIKMALIESGVNEVGERVDPGRGRRYCLSVTLESKTPEGAGEWDLVFTHVTEKILPALGVKNACDTDAIDD